MKPLACLFLLLLCACAPVSDPYTMSTYADGAISATEIAVVERAQIATLDAALAQSALVVQQTQAAMYATATSQEQAAQSTMVAAQHTAVMDALRGTHRTQNGTQEHGT